MKITWMNIKLKERWERLKTQHQEYHQAFFYRLFVESTTVLLWVLGCLIFPVVFILRTGFDRSE